MASPESRTAPGSSAHRPLQFGLAAALVALAFAAITGHAWEDYFITFRASLNLATGHGLVYQPGERVHTFTSPLGTLLPALFALGGGEDVAGRALWGLRLVSAAALGGALWLAVRAFQRDGLTPLALTAASVAWILDPKTVDFSMNGMETALVVFFVTYTWQAFSAGARLWPCALACAGLQWTRPDGCVYFAALAGSWLFLEASTAGFSWRARLVHLLRVVAVGAALYLPWFLFVWIYYGSPVPHTILAKMGTTTPRELATLLALYPWRLLFGHTALHDLFLPAYHLFGGWPEELRWGSRLLVLGAAVTWIGPRVAPAGRLASLAFFLGGFYVTYLPPFPWYYPGWQALALLAWGYLLHAVWRMHPRPAWMAALLRSATRIAAVALVLTQAGLFACVTWQMRAQQSLIENQHRREIGRWLHQNANARDTVFLESLGYIGYYSELKMLDYPGLAAPEVVAARRAGHRKWAGIIQQLQPDWIVVRPGEAKQIFIDGPALRARYHFLRAFDVRPAIDAFTLLPGRGYLEYDATFLVYRRTPANETRL